MIPDFLKKISSYIIVVAIVVSTKGVGQAQVLLYNEMDAPMIVFNDDVFCDIDYQIDNKKFDKKKKTEIKALDVDPDTDGDGVPDKDDLCPYVAGSKKAQGCPDKDGDGVPDFMDECPDVPGLSEFKGCPDSDGDGIPDHKDECPFEKGPASRKGCPIEPKKINTAIRNEPISNSETPIAEVRVINIPKRIYLDQSSSAQHEVIKDHNYYIELARRLEIEAKMIEDEERQNNQSYKPNDRPVALVSGDNKIPMDTDKDGIPDVEDKCPTEPGPKSNFGCPVTSPKSNLRLWKVSGHDIILSNDEAKLLDDILNNLKFSAGRSILNENSYIFLDQLAGLLNKKYSWTMVLYCYTSEAGNTYRNQQLSSNRGDHIRSYLTSKGVSYNRIQVKGLGDSLADSSTNRIEVEITR